MPMILTLIVLSGLYSRLCFIRKRHSVGISVDSVPIIFFWGRLAI